MGGGGELIPRRRCEIGMQLTYKEAQMLRNEDQARRKRRPATPRPDAPLPHARS